MANENKNSVSLTSKQKIGDSANKWLSKNKSLVLRQTPKWAQSMAIIVISLGSIVVIGSIFLKIDEVITVQGQLKPIGGIVDLKTPASGKVDQIYFKDGDYIRKGSLMMSFDTREALQKQKTISNIISLEKLKFEGTVNQFNSEVKSLNRKQKVLSKRLSTQQYLLNEMAKLVEVGGFQRVQFLKQQDQVFELEVQINEINEEGNKLNLRFQQASLDYQQKKDQLANQLRVTELQLQYQNVTAPTSGIAFDPKAYVGSVLQSGQTIVSIVPQKGLNAEVFVPNKDIGFVQTGQSVKVRVDAFPYSRYGEITGKIMNIGADALKPDQNLSFYRFPVKIKLEKSFLQKNNQNIPLKAGMAVSTNIKLREKRLISLVSDIFVSQTDSLETLRQQ